MKRIFLIIALFPAALFAQSSMKLHKQSIVVDTHGDIISDQIKSGIDLGKKQTGGNFDLVRAKEGGLDVQVFSIWCDETGGYAMANRQIDSLESFAKRYPKDIMMVRTAADLIKTVKANKMAAMIGVEGGHMIESRLDYLETLALRGMTYMTLTWNNSTPWASSAYDETFRKDSLKQPGLTEFGKQVVRRMNDLGVIVDLSHVGETTFYDAIQASSKPVMASHSSVYALNPHQRNLKDAQIKAIARTGGVVFVNFYTGFLDSTYSKKRQDFSIAHANELLDLSKKYKNRQKAQDEINTRYQKEIFDMRAPLSLLIDHIDYMVKLVGSEHVGLGADFDGAESYPQHLDDVSDYQAITEALKQKGYSNKDVTNILGANFIRLLKANKGQ